MDRLLDVFAADRDAYVARIRAVWRDSWSAQVFQRQARALVSDWLATKERR